jgi:hypothetical protein
MSDLTDYVSSMELDDPMPGLKEAMGEAFVANKVAGGGTVDVTPGKEEAFVDAGSTVSFAANVSGQNRQDVLNSTLLAQLAANKQYNRQKQPERWYEEYATVLGKVGWVIQDFRFVKYKSSGNSLEIDKAVINILAAALAGKKTGVIQETLDALKALPEKDGRLVLFNRMASSRDTGNFQISLATETNGALAMTIGAFHFTSSQSTTQFLFANYSASSTDLFQGAQTVTLNEQIYGTVRGAILAKLGTNAVDAIAAIEI